MPNKDLKDKVLKQEMSDKELEGVAGGGCWFGARFEAPDGHDVGCSMLFYDNKLDFSQKGELNGNYKSKKKCYRRPVRRSYSCHQLFPGRCIQNSNRQRI